MQALAFANSASVRTAPVCRRCLHAVRAENSSKPSAPTASTDGTVFFAGNTYTESEWATAQATSTFKPAPVSDAVETEATAPTIGKLMAFDGRAPELVNGRLSMLAFTAAVGAELASGEGIISQWKEAPVAIGLTFLTFAIATLIPLTLNSKPEDRELGPFKATPEILNGRAAMLGFVALLVIEQFQGGKPLF